jgi:hypothetical protein
MGKACCDQLWNNAQQHPTGRDHLRAGTFVYSPAGAVPTNGLNGEIPNGESQRITENA